MEYSSNEKYEKIVVRRERFGSVSDKEKSIRKFVNDLLKIGDFLKKLKKLSLVELTLHMPYNGDTFEIIRLFPNLEMLSMDHWKGKETFPTSFLIDLPSKLKRIKLNGIKISYKTLLSLVQELKFLEEFDVGRGDIFWNLDECKFFLNKNFINVF